MNPAAAVIGAWLLLHGYSEPQARIVMGNIARESQFHPCAIARDGSEGLFQMHGRLRWAMHRYAGTRSCVPVETQLAYMDQEWRGRSCSWRFFGPERDLSAFERCFERGRVQ